MDDLLTEKEQWEALKRWVRENGLAIVAGVAVAALGLGGYRWWQAHQNGADLAAGALFIQMENAFAQGDRTQAFILLGDLERDYPSSPYADQARLASAKAFVDDNELGRAADVLRGVVQNTRDDVLKPIARLRLARVQIAQRQLAEALVTLNGADAGALAAQYAEARGDAYYAMGEKASALAQYRLARATDTSGDSESGLLDLKISDLAAEAVPMAIPGGRPPGPGVVPGRSPLRGSPAAKPAVATGQNPGKP